MPIMPIVSSQQTCRIFYPEGKMCSNALCSPERQRVSVKRPWRGWANFLDVWLEENLLIECVSNA